MKSTTQNTMDEMSKTSKDIMESYLEAFQMMAHYARVPQADWQDLFNINHIYKQWFNELSRKHTNVSEVTCNFAKDFLALCDSLQSMLFGKPYEPIIKPDKGDRRFRSTDWHELPAFFFLHQAYLLFVHHCLQFVENNKSKDPKIARQIRFFTRQYLDMISPTNYLFTNPDAIRHIFTSKGENLSKGIKNFLEDVIKGEGHLNISMTDMSAFTVGKDLAISKGKVIFQNRLMQLIQYFPSTAKTYQIPLLIIPPWINKYYILDLREKNSFVKWAVDQGFTVFMISWVNPDEGFRNTTFDDYLFEGIMSALDAILKATGEEKINALGFCIGGTLLAAALAYMRAIKDKRIVSATFLTSLIDFSDPGEISVFIDENQIQTLERKMEEEGYLDGRLLMTTFNMLRANDLFWPYYINNYLFGQNPFPFDLLYWNCDSTNLPNKMTSFYLRNFYLENRLVAPMGLELGGVPINITRVDVPAYFLSTEHDHIAPWKTTFIGAQKLSGSVTFILGGSGHIAGVINPPNGHKYAYRYAEQEIKSYANANEWYDNSKTHDGSWWNHWGKWVERFTEGHCNARVPGDGKLKPIQDAPGDYVKRRLLHP